MANEILYSLYRPRCNFLGSHIYVCGFCRFGETVAYSNRVAVTDKSRSRGMTGPGVLAHWREVKKNRQTTAPRIPAWSPTVVLTERHFG